MAVEGESTTDEDSSDRTRELLAGMSETIDRGEMPLRIFNDPELYELELYRIFSRSWVFVGHETEIPEPGDYVRRYVGEDPFILVRDEEGEVRVFFDSCRHRGTKICRAEQGNTSHFRCPYHGWTYRNTGELVGVPEQRKAYKELDKCEWSLRAAPRTDDYEGLVFVSLSEDGPSLEEHLAGMPWYMDIILNLPENGWEIIGEPHRFEVENDWKLGAENFGGDDYHTHTAHQSALDAAMYSEEVYKYELPVRRHIHFEDGHSAGVAMVESDRSPFLGFSETVQEVFTEEGLSDEQYGIARRLGACTGTIFPNLSYFGMAAGNRSESSGIFSLRQWQPKGPGKMEFWNWYLVPKGIPQEEKERIYDVAVGTFSPAGTWEQDDFAVWDGISKSAGSTFTKKQNLTTNYQMGSGDMSDANPVDDWAGPGIVVDSHYEDNYAQAFYRRWHSEVTTPEGE